METTTIKIAGMSCQHCVASVTDAVSAVQGVQTVAVDLSDGTATVTYDSTVAQPGALQAAIEEQGFDVLV